ncbi:MAG: SGNH/GDSL hydrolase N-terminal domain-containing protein [Ferruginibacter sp.]
MKVKILLIIICLITVECCLAQNPRQYKSWNPATDTLKVLEGQYWPFEVKDYYDRLPAAAEHIVRKEVWNLSKNSAGLQLRFQTNASEIVVKYIVSGTLQFPHMPATGVSGIDLYAKTIDGERAWSAGRYSFGDTIIYRFNNLTVTDRHVNNREYILYLPLYNSVKWMEITVPKLSLFKTIPARKDRLWYNHSGDAPGRFGMDKYLTRN